MCSSFYTFICLIRMTSVLGKFVRPLKYLKANQVYGIYRCNSKLQKMFNYVIWSVRPNTIFGLLKSDYLSSLSIQKTVNSGRKRRQRSVPLLLWWVLPPQPRAVRSGQMTESQPNGLTRNDVHHYLALENCSWAFTSPSAGQSAAEQGNFPSH